MEGEPLDLARAEQLIRAILSSGETVFSNHALDEMPNRDLTAQDCKNVLRGGWVESSELEKGTWRYRVRTARMCVVIAFRSESRLVVVTAWRDER